MTPTFSIIIPTFNRKAKIVKCIESVCRQSLPKSRYEVIVVDDCSTDGTYEMIKGVDEIAILKLKKHMGRSVARNFGASKATGRYLAFTDSDCVVPENWLEKLLDGYKRFSGAVAVGGGVANESPSVYGKYENKVFASYINGKTRYVSTKRDELPFALGNMSYHRAAFLDIGGFNERIPDFCSYEDADLKERFLRNKKKFVFVRVFVLHNHDFGIKDFCRQSLQRGAGMLLDSKRKGKIQSRPEILCRLFLTPLYWIYSMASFRLDPILAFVDTLFFFFRNLGKLKYHGKISRLRL